MRLWHKNLIEVLPTQHLVAQWRELSAIAGAIQKNGTPNHILVNFVLDYDYDNFISYAAEVREELADRGCRTMIAVWNKITSLKEDWKRIPLHSIYIEKMDNKYLTICYYNLYEKYLCGGINQKDWDNIFKKMTKMRKEYE